MERIELEKITLSKGEKMCQGTGHTIWHINWYPPLECKNPDCSHFVSQFGKDYKDPTGHLAVVIYDRKAIIRRKLRKWEHEGRNHPMREFLEEELKELEAKEQKC